MLRFVSEKGYPGKKMFINIILDVSGSMGKYCESITKVFNTFVGELKRENAYKNAFISVLKFNTEVEEVLPYTPLGEVKEIDTIERLNGGTDIGKALLKGIENTQAELARSKAEDKHYYSPFVLLITDGVSNAGHGAGADVKKVIVQNFETACKQTVELFEKEGWLFQVMCLENQEDDEQDVLKALKELERITPFVGSYQDGQSVEFQVKRLFEMYKISLGMVSYSSYEDQIDLYERMRREWCYGRKGN